MTATDQTLAAEPRCADCDHGTLAHNAIGGACTKCDCGHFRPEATSATPTIPVPASELVPGRTVRFTGGTEAENGDFTVAEAVTRHGTGYAFTRITWTDGMVGDVRASEDMDVVQVQANAGAFEVVWPDGEVYTNRHQQTRLTEAEAKATAPRIGGTWRRVTGQEG